MAQKITTLFIDDIDGARPRGPFASAWTVRVRDRPQRRAQRRAAQSTRKLRLHARKVGGTARRGAARASRRSSTVDTVADHLGREQGSTSRTWPRPGNIWLSSTARDGTVNQQSMGGINLRLARLCKYVENETITQKE